MGPCSDQSGASVWTILSSSVKCIWARFSDRIGHFTAPINAFNVSSDGQQQLSTPLFGSGAAWPSMPISTRQPVIGAPLNRSVSLTIIDGEKTSVFVAFGRGAETSSARASVALSDVFAGGVVVARLLSGWSSQQRLEPCE
jgi:hypothetical protein